MSLRMLFACFAAVAVATTCAAQEPLRVASLHPLLADLARRVGGNHVEVIELIGKTGDPHHFTPTPADLKRAESATIFLASGKGLEAYLPSLRDTLGNRATLVDVGKDLPSLASSGTHDDDDDDDHHSAEDPHWWHSIDLFRRATTTVASVFSHADPAHAADYQANSLAYRARLDDLEQWARRQLARIPKGQRKLATSHAAFNYLCHDFGLSPFPLEGINREQMPAPGEISALIRLLRTNHITAIFPEKESNPKLLEALTRDTAVRLATPLIADGTNVTSYEEMVRHNINSITAALAP